MKTMENPVREVRYYNYFDEITFKFDTLTNYKILNVFSNAQGNKTYVFESKPLKTSHSYAYTHMRLSKDNSILECAMYSSLKEYSEQQKQNQATSELLKMTQEN